MNLLRSLYQIFRLRVIQVMAYALLLAVIAVILNFAGLKVFNAIIGCLLPILIVFITTTPSIAAAIVGLGVIPNLRHPIAGTKNAVEVWARFVCAILLYESIFFLVCGFVSFSRNPAAVPIVFISLLMLFLIFINWEMKVNIFRRLVYTYTLVTLSVAVGSLISGPIYMKAVGFDPCTLFRVSSLDEIVYEIANLEQQNTEQTAMNKLEVIKAKMESGGTLTDDETLLWEETKQQTQQQTLISNGKKMVCGLLPSSKPQPIPPPREVAWNVREVSGDWTFIADIYNGDTVMFISKKPFKKLYKPSGKEYFENASNPGKYWHFTIGDCPPGEKCQMFFRSLDGSTFTVDYQIKRNM